MKRRGEDRRRRKWEKRGREEKKKGGELSRCSFDLLM